VTGSFLEQPDNRAKMKAAGKASLDIIDLAVMQMILA
jgi:hypothetical protein